MGYFGLGWFVAITLFIVSALLPFIPKWRRKIIKGLEDIDLEETLVGLVFVALENEKEEEISFGSGMIIMLGYVIYILILSILGLVTILLYPLVVLILLGGLLFRKKSNN